MPTIAGEENSADEKLLRHGVVLLTERIRSLIFLRNLRITTFLMIFVFWKASEDIRSAGRT